MNKSFACFLVAACFEISCTSNAQKTETQSAPATPTARIIVNASAKRVPVSPDLYGIFFEDINHAADGGLSGEMIQNRDFEASTLAPGWRVDGDSVFNPQGWKTRKWFDSDLPGWSLVAEGGAEGEMHQDGNQPLNDRNPHSLRLTASNLGQRCGIANGGFWGMNIEEGKWYDVTFYARLPERARGTALIFSLESADGSRSYTRVTLPEIGGSKWAKHSVSLHPRASDPKARLVISLLDPGTVWLDCVSLYARDTFQNRPGGLRNDLAQMLAGLKPRFLRFPGGCVVEGVTLQNRFRWKDSIGDASQRQGGFNVWGYYSTYALGFHEYLQLAEDLGADAIYVINSGTSCQASTRRPVEVATDADLATYVQDSMDALEYALGPADSKWGAKRIANGHPEPFKIKYVEIGNENHGVDYQKHYKVFYDAIKAKYPQVITIADTRITDSPIELLDDHFYGAPEKFFQMANHYDAADRKGPKIYVGEYAVTRGVGPGNLRGALAEAVFMLDMERNSDVVQMCSYAPLFENINDRAWPVNLIRFDSSRVVGRTSYQVQKLFAANRPDVVLQTTVEAQQIPLPPIASSSSRPATAPTQPAGPIEVSQIYSLAGLDQKSGELVIKVVNPGSSAVTTSIAVNGFAKLGDRAKVVMLSNEEATAENTLDDPQRVVPAETQVPVSGSTFSVSVAPNSLTILRVAAE